MAISIVTSVRVVSFSIFVIFINCLIRAAKISHIDSFQFSNVKIRGVSLGCLNESISQGVSYSASDINISDCFFSRSSHYAGNGGVIFVISGSYSMYINNSMFYNCSSSLNGGAIFFYSSNSCLGMICAHSCSATSLYHFAYIKTSQVNQLEYLSVSKCSHTTSGDRTICLDSGNQTIDNTNSSMNNANQCSGIYTYTPSSFTSSHCTFSNNKVSNSICVFFFSIIGTISMSYANIVHNNSPSYGVVFANGGGSRKMMYCIFQNNQNTLFCVLSGSLEVSHSFIDHSGSLSTSIAVSTATNNTFTNRMTYQLQFFNSLHCNTDNPQKTNDPNGIKSDSLILYLAIGLIIILIVIISYNFGRQRIHNSSQITAP